MEMREKLLKLLAVCILCIGLVTTVVLLVQNLSK